MQMHTNAHAGESTNEIWLKNLSYQKNVQSQKLQKLKVIFLLLMFNENEYTLLYNMTTYLIIGNIQ